MAFGLLAWLYFLGGSPGLWPVIFSHTLIALYVMIVISDSWFERDVRHEMLLRQSGLSIAGDGYFWFGYRETADY